MHILKKLLTSCILTIGILIPQSLSAAQRTAPNNVTFVKVSGQQGADCGYHALYNGLAQYLSLQRLEQPAFNLAQWRKQIIQLRKEDIAHYDRTQATFKQRLNDFNTKQTTYLAALKNAKTKQAKANIEKNRPRKPIASGTRPSINNGELIDHNEVNMLVDQLYADLVSPDNYSVIGNVMMPRATLEIYPNAETFDARMHALRTAHGTYHIFVINSGGYQKTNQSISFSAGHWIAVVAYNDNGTIKYYVRDSINGKPIDMVNAVKKIVDPNAPSARTKPVRRLPTKPIRRVPTRPAPKRTVPQRRTPPKRPAPAKLRTKKPTAPITNTKPITVSLAQKLSACTKPQLSNFEYVKQWLKSAYTWAKKKILG